jgi:tubulin polyglutamylase TTLL6/13
MPAPGNLNNLFMHLTNYAINKESAKYQQNDSETRDDVGHKRSYAAVMRLLRAKHGDEAVDTLSAEINDIIIKTMCIAQPHVHHLIRSAQPDDLQNETCFQILGFDVILDDNLRPYLLEVNQMPSFATDSPLDSKIKSGVIFDTIAMLNLSRRRRYKQMLERKKEQERRLMQKFNPGAVDKKQVIREAHMFVQKEKAGDPF